MSVMSPRGDLVPVEGFRVDPLRQTGRATDDLLDLRQLWNVVRSHSRIAAVIMGLSLLLATAFLLLVPPTYTATSVLLIDPRQERVLTSEAVLSGIGADAAAVESQVELVRSTALASKVIDRLGLMTDPELSGPSFLSTVKQAIFPRGAAADPAKAEILRKNKVIDRFREQMTVRRRGLTYVLEVGFDSIDAAKAARIANTVADIYLNDQVEIKSDATASASKWLEQRIEMLRDKVRDAARAVADFKAKHNIVEVGGANSGLTLNKRQIEQINHQLVLARARVAEAGAKFEQVRQVMQNGVDPGSLPEALNSEVIAKLRVEYSTVARVEADFSSTYGPGHPNLTRIRSQLSKMREQITKEMARILASAKNAYEIAQTRRSSLAQSLKALEKDSANLSSITVRQAELEREAQANRTLFEQFLSRSKETREQSNLQRSDARVVAYAIEPVEPSHPRKSIVLLIASAGGLMLAFGSVLVAHNLDRSYRSRTTIEADLGLPCIAVCPSVSPGELGIRTPLHTRLRSWFGLGNRSDGAIDNGNFAYRKLLALAGMNQSGSQYADAVRAIRLGCTAAQRGSAPKVILISSTVSGEGKSTIAANIARSLARTGAYTLLLDADTRTGALSSLFCQPGAPGLSEVLSGEETLKSASIYEMDSGMFFLPIGRSRLDLDETDMLVDDRFANFLGHYREGFDYIVIDAPPVLSMVDGQFLFRYADAALYVVEWGKTGSEFVIAGLNTLGWMRSKIIGTVLNKADPAATGTYSYGYGNPPA